MVGENNFARLSAFHCYFSGPCIENERNLTNKAVEPRQEIDPKGHNGASSGRLFSSTKSQKCVQLINRISLKFHSGINWRLYSLQCPSGPWIQNREVESPGLGWATNGVLGTQ